MTKPDKVNDHYGRASVMDELSAALGRSGLAEGTLSVGQLAPLDQFHSRGLAATMELAKSLDPSPDWSILDLGSGLGGPSRYLAATYGCRVTGVDLNPSYVEAAAYLADRVGLSDKVAYRRADALELPFDDASFDGVWTQHVAMNIADRARLYAEARRVLCPGGRLAIYDVLAGDGGPLLFPVPWSRGPETSFLLGAEAMRTALEREGFAVRSWVDRTAAGVAWFDDPQRTRGVSGADATHLGLHVVMGPDFETMSANLGRNLREGRAMLLEAVVVRS